MLLETEHYRNKNNNIGLILAMVKLSFTLPFLCALIIIYTQCSVSNSKSISICSWFATTFALFWTCSVWCRLNSLLHVASCQQIWVLLCKYPDPTWQQIAVIKSLLENYLNLLHTVALVIVIEHKNFVSLVLVNVQLWEYFVYLDVCCRHTHSISYVTRKVFLYGTQINQ